MTPEERTRLNKLEETVRQMQRVEDISFVENIKRRIDFEGNFKRLFSLSKIGELLNVDDTGVSNGQILKYNSTTEKYVDANDLIA